MLNLKNTLDGYLKNVEVVGNTIQNTNNLADIRSVGDKVDGQELYKIDVVSCGKNLFDKTKCIKGVIGANGVISTNNEWNVSEFIKVRPDMQLVKTTFADMCAFDINKNPIGIIANGTTMFTIPANCYYIRCNVNNVSLDTYQLEEGTVATPYEPYQEQKLEILSPVQLEKVGDVADRIICKDGVWGIEKNIKTIVLDGSESWSGNGESNISMRFSMVRDKNVNYDLVPRLDVILSDMYVKRNVDWNSDIEGIENGAHDLSIRLSRTRLSTHDVAGFKEWLKTNNTLVKYQTRTSQFISLPHDQQVKLRTFAGQTNIAFLTEIAGQIKAQVPKSLGAVVNTHTEQIADLHNSLERVKKLEETTASIVTTESNFTIVEETSDGYFEDIKLEGKTLVNLLKQDNFSMTNSGGDTQASFSPVIPMCLGEYTLIFNCDAPDDLGRQVGILLNDFDWDTIPVYYFHGLNVFKVTVTQEGDHKIRYRNDVKNTKVTISNIVLLEGDHTNNPPSYFEGLTSVGQDVEEASVESCFNVADIAIDGDTNFEVAHIKKGIPYSISVKRSANIGYNLVLRRNGKETILVGNSYSDFNTFTSNEDGVLFYNSHGKVTVSEIMLLPVLYSKDTMPKYKPYSPNKKPLLYFNPTTETWEKPILREWDTIEKHSDGKYYYHKRSGEVVLNGRESWVSDSTAIHTAVDRYLVPFPKAQGLSRLLCDNFTVLDTTNINVEGVLIGSDKSIYCNITKSKLSTQDVAGFKAWLKANPTTIVYQLAQEEVYECANIDLMTYSGETNYIINSGAISPKSLLKVHNNISNVVKILQEKVSLLENTFIAGLKSVLSGDMYSLATILYPEDFEQNDNTEQDIMVIPE